MLMLDLSIIAVDFNGHTDTKRFLESLNRSVLASSHKLDVFVVIVCNGEMLNVSTDLLNHIHLKIISSGSNLGYFGGINYGLEYLRSRSISSEHYLVCNNDILFPENFSLEFFDFMRQHVSYFVISPSLLGQDGKNQNPLFSNKPSLFKRLKLNIIFSCFPVFAFCSFMSNLVNILISRYSSSINDLSVNSSPFYIYSGYGAAYLLSNSFVESCGSLYMPTFLMGEEFFLTYQLALLGKNILFYPSIVLFHTNHASLNRCKYYFLWSNSKRSFGYRINLIKSSRLSNNKKVLSMLI